MRTHSVLFVLICALGARVAQTTPIPYGNVNGDDVVYQQITEDPSPAPTSLYGAPGVGGDSLVSSPWSPEANGTNGPLDITDGMLAPSLRLIFSSWIADVRFAERADHFRAGSGTSNTTAPAAASLFVRSPQRDSGLLMSITASFNRMYSPSDGTYDLTNVPAGP